MAGKTGGHFGADRIVVALLLLLVLWTSLNSVTHRRLGITESTYIGIGYSLATAGVFGLGSSPDGLPTPTHVREPGYAGFLALGILLFLDPASQDPACLRRDQPECHELQRSLRSMHLLLVLPIALLVYLAAVRLCGRGWFAVVALALFLLQGNAIRLSMTYFGAESLAALLLVCHAFLLLLIAEDPHRRAVTALAGILLGLLVLTSAVFIFYVLGGLGLIVLAAAFRQWRTHPAFRPALTIVLIAFAMMTAWIGRNIVVMDSPLLTQRGNGVLVRRIEHTTMSWPEVAVSYLYYAPYVGRGLAKQLLEEDQYIKLTRGDPEGYHRRMKDGGGIVNARTEANLKSTDPRFAILVRIATPLQVMIENLPRQLALTPAFLWRGMGMRVLDRWSGVPAADSWLGVVARVFTLLLLPAVIWASVRAWRHQRWRVVVFLLPSLYLIVIHAVITHGLARFNEPTIPCAIVGLCWLVQSLTGRRRTGQQADQV